MPEFTNMASGEVLDFEPMNPLELEFIIREIGERLENSIPALKQMWHDRYEAERELIKARAMALLNSKADTVTEKRAEADLAALPFRLEFDLKKESLHAAEELQKALTAKLYGFLNLNKALASSYNASGR